MPIKLFIKATPNSKKLGFGDIIIVDEKKYIKLGISAPATDGKANEAIINFLSSYFKIAKKDISITSGLTNKYKTVTIQAINQELTEIETLLK